MAMRADWKREWEDWRRAIEDRFAEQEGMWKDYEWIWGMVKEMEGFEVELR